MPGERRGGRKRATPNRRTILADRMMVVLAGCSALSLKERIARLVNDQELPADIRLAIAQRAFPRRARHPRSAHQAPKTPVETISPSALDALSGIVTDANAPSGGRWKAALKLAEYFLPKKAVDKRWRFVEDECGFAINAEIARDHRTIHFELAVLEKDPRRDFSEFAQRIAKLQARRDAISQRVKCPCPTRYGRKQSYQDFLRLVKLNEKRNAGGVLTAEEDAEEAHRKARFDCYSEGPEQTARRARLHLEAADFLFRKNRSFNDPTPPPLSRKERHDLWLLRWLYPPHENYVSDPNDHPFARTEPAADGNFYSQDSRLRPAASAPDGVEEFVEYADVAPYCIYKPGQPPFFTDELPDDFLTADSNLIQR
jgi:hypothetical protein